MSAAEAAGVPSEVQLRVQDENGTAFLPRQIRLEEVRYEPALYEVALREVPNEALVNGSVWCVFVSFASEFDAPCYIVSSTTSIYNGTQLDSPIARIQFTLNALERRPNGAVVGSIWVGGDTPGAAFPEMDWSDFPVALLATWLPALRRLAARGQTAECHFMDGPYHFTVTAVVPEDGGLHVSRTARDRTRRTPSPSGQRRKANSSRARSRRDAVYSVIATRAVGGTPTRIAYAWR